MKKLLMAIPAAALVLAISAPAFATKYISSRQAVAAAKAKVKGRVIDVDSELDSRRPHYDVDILSKGRKYELKVDARTGKVYSKRIDYDD
ncbi:MULTISPECIES: PepSY domain-containing protein [unclassified Neisseria]|uniref:PepSY domain-containing protein n=1 Tax=unclassified Neisseria TaxID=2623750 RepID=UPI002666A8C6|nr:MULTISPECIES: PepSY domain-containing protein [unclassified Neisseria]MDO1510159.1 PepSY domain-containing protein [Neisseria sp. MVDL19-042950]MDO1516735.1 PepSY domain-containing protein [Neisseria sp. MVDL18-041461]MDO1563882.1 PepSY domain-containing protein [Neisseria sp. MVDL20-010259]